MTYDTIRPNIRLNAVGSSSSTKHSESYHGVRIPDGLYAHLGVMSSDSELLPQEIYVGSNPIPGQQVKLKIANGGAGQAGLIKAWANAFIDFSVQQLNMQPFSVAWYLGDTTQSLGLLSEGSVDIAVTYNEAAEKQKMKTGEAIQRFYAFRDHFYLVGPESNPAGLDEHADTVLDMFNKIVTLGNRDIVSPPKNNPPVRFLSRYDKSATNIKECELFIAIGQVPWALTYSNWYHQYPQFPRQALSAASSLSEYTLTDRGTWLSTPKNVTSKLKVFKRGLDDDPADPLLNPGRVLLGKHAAENKVAHMFMSWVVDTGDKGGQAVVDKFMNNGEVLYSKAP